MTLGEIVQKYRGEHDVSQRQFAISCGLSNGYISMLEKNVNPKTGLPLVSSLPAYKKIADAIGISLNELLTKIDDSPIEVTEEDEQIQTPTVNLDSGRMREFGELFEKLPFEKQALILHQIKEFLKGL